MVCDGVAFVFDDIDVGIRGLQGSKFTVSSLFEKCALPLNTSSLRLISLGSCAQAYLRHRCLALCEHTYTRSLVAYASTYEYKLSHYLTRFEIENCENKPKLTTLLY